MQMSRRFFLLYTMLCCALAHAEKLAPDAAKQAVGERAHMIVKLLAAGEFSRIAKFVDPQKGVRFSPYANIDTDSDVVLSCADLRSPSKLQAVRKWGAYDGSGAPIRLSFRRYYRQFIYDRNFAQAPKIGYNEQNAKSSTAGNIDDTYADAITVEYYFPPPNATEETHWSALRLIFQRTGDDWFLVGIVHDQWTV